MFGAIAGDIIGSVYEYDPIRTEDFPLFDADCRFTDDTVMTVAVAHAILEGADYAATMKAFGRRYPDAGYGGAFIGFVGRTAAVLQLGERGGHAGEPHWPCVR